MNPQPPITIAIKQWCLDKTARALGKRGYRVEKLRPRDPAWLNSTRYDFQKDFVPKSFPEGSKVLDVGSGHEPYPLATVLGDRFTGETVHRCRPLLKDNRSVVQFDVCQMPFRDKSFDFIFCSHVLEHVEDPIAACREITRTGKRGYIETPSLYKDMAFGWAMKTGHKWHTVCVANHLVFFEYSERQLEGFCTGFFRDHVLSSYQHPLQDIYEKNYDVTNNMLLWEGQFCYHVFYQNGVYRSSKNDKGL